MSADNAEQFNIHDAKTNLSRIIERVEHGEEIVISRAGTPVAKVVPLTRRVDRRGRGSLRDRLVLAPHWDSGEREQTVSRDFGWRPYGFCWIPTLCCGGWPTTRLCPMRSRISWITSRTPL